MRALPLRRIAVLFFIFLLVCIWAIGADVFSFDNVQEHRAMLLAFVDQNYVLSLIVFTLTYGFSAAVAFPLGGIFVLLAGFLYGPVLGTLIAVVVGTLGNLVAFLLVRGLLHDWVERRFGERLAPIEREIAEHPASYLLFLRFMPVVPYMVINAGAALVRVPLSTYIWTSLLGLLPGAIIFAFAGRELGRITSTGDVVTPSFILTLILLALLSFVPLVYKKMRARKLTDLKK